MDTPIAKTTSGVVRGAVHDGIAVFKGIPYGGPVGGTRRFQPAGPPDAWTGVRDALHYGNTAPQVEIRVPPERVGPLQADFVGIEDSPAQGEDCLVLNVWTPATGEGELRPVMVWLHAGGYEAGSGSSPINEGTRLAERDVVVVSVNHRVAALGYLYLAELGDERFAQSGNIGTLDLVLALQWVRDNIAEFGGDPANVTIFGVSGGAAKATALLATPAAQGLFHRSISHSGVDAVLRTRASSTEPAEKLLALLEISARRIEDLFDVPVARILEASAHVHHGINVFWPVVDDVVVRQHPVDAIAAGSAADVAVIIGTARHETARSLPLDDATGLPKHNGLFERLPEHFGDATDSLLDVYRGARPDASDTELYVAMSTDRIRIPSIRLLEAKAAGGGEPGFLFEIAFAHPAAGGVYGAVHGIDAGMMFDNLDTRAIVGRDPAANSIARRMTDAWAAFARTGTPSAEGMPEWPPYTPARRATMVIDREWTVEDDRNPVEREAWAAVDLTNTGLLSRIRLP
jgi:para-nitrobenzyl esterase